MKRKNAFTLIELLIVVAIIGILAAIAVPNFLNAQVRAKVARTQADLRTIVQAVNIRQVDTNQWIIDGNDCNGTPECCHQGEYFGKMVNDTGLTMAKGQSGTIRFNGQNYLPLTTPISYLSTIPVDPFGDGLFYSYEDWGCSNEDGAWALLSAFGPDGDNGDWHRSDGGPDAYHPTNGVVSNGDIWYTWEIRSNGAGAQIFRQFYSEGWSSEF